MSRPVWITGDVHLDGSADQPARRGFFRFLAAAAGEAAAVYVLGDLFDYWVGPAQAQRSPFRELLAELSACARRVPVHLLPGNRDFAMGPEVGELPGVTLHGETIRRRWGGKEVLLTHGDSLLAADRSYQRLRRVLRSPWVLALLRRAPGGVSLTLARRLRAASRRQVARKRPTALRPAPAVLTRLFAGGVDVVICGHVHRAALAAGEVAGKRRLLVTLGAWGARGWYARVGAEGSLTLESFPPGEQPHREPLFRAD